MPVLRKEHKTNYTCIDNAVLRAGMSLKAVGLLCTMLALPDEWEFSEHGLTQILTDGKGTIKSAIKELEENSFLQRKQARNENGKMGKAVWVISDYPMSEKPMSEKPMSEKPMSEKPMSEKPMSENQTQLNKYILNNNILNNKKENKKEKSKEVEEIIAHLNAKAHTNYRATTAKTKSLINARLNENFTVDDFKQVIDTKCAEWLNDKDMCKYLRPETLFGTKFESYLNQKQAVPFNANSSMFGVDESAEGWLS